MVWEYALPKEVDQRYYLFVNLLLHYLNTQVLLENLGFVMQHLDLFLLAWNTRDKSYKTNQSHSLKVKIVVSTYMR